MARGGRCKAIIAIPFLLLSGILYIIDVVSDIMLAIRYFRHNDIWWASLTAGFVIASWLFTLVRAFWEWKENRDDRETTVALIWAVFDMLPVYLLILAIKKFCQGKTSDAKNDKSGVDFYRLFEVLIESTPQAVLQMYIAGRYNRIDLLLFISISTSLISIAFGISKGIISFFTYNIEEVQRDFKLATMIFLGLFLATVAGFIPSVALVASMKDHGSAYYVFFMLQFFLHVFFCSYLTYDVPWENFLPFLPSKRTSSSKVFGVFGFLLPILYFCSCFYLSTAWIVSVAPFLPDADRNALPGFVYPNPIPPFGRWVINDTQAFQKKFKAEWAVCNITKKPIQLKPALLKAAKPKPKPKAKTTPKPTPPRPTPTSNGTSARIRRSTARCVTDYARLLYFLLLFASFSMLFQSCTLALLWPCIKEGLLAERGCLVVCLEKADRVLKGITVRVGAEEPPVSLSGRMRYSRGDDEYDDNRVVEIHSVRVENGVENMGGGENSLQSE